MMIFDLHNIAPSVGQINADRSNRRYGLLTGVEPQFGQCPFKYDIDLRLAEPGEEVRGNLARVWFYMRDRYGVVFTGGEEASHPLLYRFRYDPVSIYKIVRCIESYSEIVVPRGGFEPPTRGFSVLASHILPLAENTITPVIIDTYS